MATTTKSILNRVSTLLSDEGHDRWTEGELVGWLNDGQAAIARATNDAYVVRDNISASAGTRQSLPSNGIRLIDVIQDVATGNNIHQCDYAIVSAYDVDWRGATAATAEVYFYDERNPTEFEIFPQQAGGESIEILYNALPPDTAIGGSLTINDVYVDAIIDYVAYRAFSKDSEDTSPDLVRASAFYRAFLLSTGQKDAIDALVEPRRS